VSLVTQEIRCAVSELFRELEIALAAEAIGECGCRGVIEQAETVCRLKEATDTVEAWGGRGVIEQAMTLCRGVLRRYEAVMP
jgi:hypothetical protein